ncbi:MAG TPA: ParA family protein [Sulfurimonas sp.]|nr:ParA family protein [Sulfurimonas sp.]
MTIAISHQKGGVGKSTIAWNLATALQDKYNVELVDLDIQKTLTYTNEIRSNHTDLKPLTIKSFSTPEDFKKYINGDSDERLSIIDIGGFDSSMNRLAIITADLVITPVSDRSFELLGIKSFEKVLKELSDLIDEDIVVRVLLNNINPKKSKLGDVKTFIEKSKHFSLLDTILRARADFDKSAGLGMNVIEYNKDGKASKEGKDLVKEIIKILY